MTDLDAGIEIKLGPLELLLGKLDEHYSALDKSLKNFKRKTPFIPRTIPAENSVAGAGTYIIDLGSPTQGKLWNIISVAMFGNAGDYTPVANLTGASVYLSTAEDFASSGEVLIPSFGTTTAPGYQTFGHETIWQWPGEHVLINIVASGASGAYGNLRVLEYAIDDIAPRLI